MHLKRSIQFSPQKQNLLAIPTTAEPKKDASA